VSAVAGKSLRIGEVAELTGTTPRTIRYYEEIGLLPGSSERAQGEHRCFTEADVDRVREILRLRELLGLSLDQLSRLLEAETARAELRREYAETEDPGERQRILDQALGHIETQLVLVQARHRELEQLELELVEKRARITDRLSELSP
jgi:MerR family transcriptional regulator, repressor of the yfmOP operon